MSKPLVSVVIPTYSRPTYLKRCIESVLHQTYPSIEIFVVDDNNPDTEARTDTEVVMAAYENHPKVRYLKHECNKNGSAARNTGWKHSSGKYITYIDDDDEIASTKIQKQVECLECLDDSWGACYTGYCIVSETDGTQHSSENRNGDCYIDALMRTMYMGSGSNLLLRKSVVDEIQGYDESFKRNQDIEFLARALEHYKLAFIDEELLLIHQEGNRKKTAFEVLDGYAQHYLQKFASRIDALNEEDRERVIAVISLERCRVAFYKKKWAAGIAILRSNHVGAKYILRYMRYIIRRILTHQSYGFNGMN